MSSHAPSRPNAATDALLVVRLEDLVRTDVALEAAFAEVRRGPAAVFRVLAWRLAGRVRWAEKLATTASFDPGALPFDDAVLTRVRSERAQGRRLILSARTARPMAELIARHVGAFDSVAAPSSSQTATGSDTVPGAEVLDPAAAGAPRGGPGKTLRAALKALRPHQWTKNALVFLPALLAHSVASTSLWLQAGWAFAAFSLCASSVYVLNDLLDLHADRAHHHKRNRPFASGVLPLGFGLVMAPLLLGSAFLLAFRLSPVFAGVLGVYYVATLGYSLVLKRLVLVDVLVLAGLYTARIIAGGVAYDVRVSQWLLAFSLFFFLSLAFVKRYSEVHALRKKGLEEAKGRGYRAGDLEQLSSLGASAGFISVLVMALYINSTDVTRLYAHPERLWGILPLLLYWVSRVWLLAHRGQMHDDPIVFAIRDRVSYAVAALTVIVVWLAV